MTLIDTNVLLDVAGSDPVWGSESRARLREGALLGQLAINDLVYAELSVGFVSLEETDAFLTLLRFRSNDLGARHCSSREKPMSSTADAAERAVASWPISSLAPMRPCGTADC